MPAVLSVIAGYLIGSIPFGYVVGRLHGTDIRQHGSGNIGTTNAFRILGPAWAVVVLLLDAGKGVAACHLGSQLVQPTSGWIIVFSGLAAIAGHNWSVFLGFKGGKGAATTAGVFGYLSPWAVIVGLGTAALMVVLTRYMSLGSMLGTAAGAAVVIIAPHPLSHQVAALVAVAWVLWRHRGNIDRLRRGEERKLGRS